MFSFLERLFFAVRCALASSFWKTAEKLVRAVRESDRYIIAPFNHTSHHFSGVWSN